MSLAGRHVINRQSFEKPLGPLDVRCESLAVIEDRNQDVRFTRKSGRSRVSRCASNSANQPPIPR
jgi:hypothetical protein